jgi:hypothetical protein
VGPRSLPAGEPGAQTAPKFALVPQERAPRRSWQGGRRRMPPRGRVLRSGGAMRSILAHDSATRALNEFDQL